MGVYLQGINSSMLLPIAILLITLLAGLFLRRILIGHLLRLSRNTKTYIDDIIIDSIRWPIVIWFLMLGIYLALRFSKIPNNILDILDEVILALAILSVTMVLANIVGKLVKLFSAKLETALPATSLTQNISRIIIYIIGFLVILNSVGISITPILATLGVGGIAVALAMQDTLSNLFSGFYIIVSRQIRVGDYVKLDSGEEGYVVDINWRSTKIRMLPNNIILVPNEKLTKVIVTNYYLPEKEMAVLVNLGVHYKSDLKEVEKVTCEVAKEVMREVNGGVAEFDPFIRYGGFGESSINLTVILRAKEYVDQYLVKHEFIKRLHERYNKEGIVIPYPIRAINYEQEK